MMLKIDSYAAPINYADARLSKKQSAEPAAATNGPTEPAPDASPSSPAADQTALTSDEQQRVAELKAADQRVRAHEAAHLAAAGGLARGGANYTFTTGPDGKRYATGGEVSIDTSTADTPAATLQKMRQVRAAALAPADPSGQDRQVAAQAAVQATEAARELAAYARQAGAAQSPGQTIDTLA